MATLEKLDRLIAELDDYRTRAEAHRQLEEAGDDAAEKLMAVLADEDAPLNKQWAAIDLLAKCRCRQAVPKLVDILEAEPNLVGEAADALRDITGRDLGETADEWRGAMNKAGGDALEEGFVLELTGDEDKLAFVRTALTEDAAEISWEEDGYVYVRVPLDERKQQVLVLFEEKQDGDVDIQLYTECGAPTARAESTIDIQNVTLKSGQFAIEDKGDGDKAVVMRETVTADDLTAQVLRRRVLAMARAADELEQELHGADTI